MFGSSILEVAIGVIFVYLLLSLVCTAVNEFLSRILNQRGKNLFDGIVNLLNDPTFTGLAQKVYNHGLVDGISQASKDSSKPARRPSYMASKTFALALLDILGSEGVAESWRDLAARRQAELDAAQANLKRDKRSKDLQKISIDAQLALEKAQDILDKLEEFEKVRAELDSAVKKVSGSSDYKKIQEAKANLAKALTLGRALAAEFPEPLENIRSAVKRLPEGHTKQSLFVLIDKTKRETGRATAQVIAAEHQLEKLQENLEEWFNDSMKRVSGWYKRWTQWVLLGVGVFLVGFANVDTIMLIQRFERDNALRASIVSAADHAIQSKDGDPIKNDEARANLLNEANNLDLPFGWIPNPSEPKEYKAEQVPSCKPENGWLSCAGAWLIKVVGLLISVFAIQLGAPFWFDMLSKFVNIRSAGTPPEETTKSGPHPVRKEPSPST